MDAWYNAAFRGELDVMKEIWELAKEILTTEEIKNEMVLSTHSSGRDAWLIVSFRGNLDVMQKIWEWA